MLNLGNRTGSANGRGCQTIADRYMNRLRTDRNSHKAVTVCTKSNSLTFTKESSPPRGRVRRTPQAKETSSYAHRQEYRAKATGRGAV